MKKISLLLAMALGLGLSACDEVDKVTSPTTTTTPATVSAPVFSPAGGTYTSAQTVTLSSSTSGAVVYYTMDGSNPTVASTPYVQPITVAASATIKAIAVNAATGATSSVSSASFIITGTSTTVDSVIAPVFSIAAGQYTSAQQVILATATAGAVIHYTLDGSTPTASSPVCVGPVTVASSAVLKAVAIKAGKASAVVSASYVISVKPMVKTVVGDWIGGRDGVEIRMTFTESGTLEINVVSPAGTLVRENGDWSLKGDWIMLSNVDAEYSNDNGMTWMLIPNINNDSIEYSFSGDSLITGVDEDRVALVRSLTSGPVDVVLPPALSVPGGTFTSAQIVSLISQTPGVTIHYTLDGTTPTANSPIYVGAFLVAETSTLKVVAIKNGVSSAVITASFTIDAAVQSSSLIGTWARSDFGSTVTLSFLEDGTFSSLIAPETYSSENKGYRNTGYWHVAKDSLFLTSGMNQSSSDGTTWTSPTSIPDEAVGYRIDGTDLVVYSGTDTLTFSGLVGAGRVAPAPGNGTTVRKPGGAFGF
ncbi:MAG: hypothetical protein RL318_1325 [Fibrobacterota bacterium]|jgi:hypothetical protein